MSLSHLLIVSLGNPAPYKLTLHSAGHLALAGLQSKYPIQYPAFERQKLGSSKTLASLGPTRSLIQCPTLMNVSGPWVYRVWADMTKGLDKTSFGLVVVHDDMEEEPGVVKIRDWTRSARGHNGVKSVKAHMAPFAGCKFARISIGIGHPEARDQESIIKHVLGPIPASILDTIRYSAPQISEALAELEGKWTGQLE